MKDSRIFWHSLFGSLACSLFAVAQAAENPGGACRFCPEAELQEAGSLNFSLAQSLNEPLQFSPDNALKEEGDTVSAWLDAVWSQAQIDGDYRQLELQRLGLDNPSVQAVFGRRASYSVALSYQEFVPYPEALIHTPYVNPGASTLALPAGWQTAGGTTSMPGLQGPLSQYAETAQRRWWSLGLRWQNSSHWSSSVAYTRRQRDGLQQGSASLLTQASLLPVPIDYLSETLQASVQYQRPQWLAKLSYALSLFRNQHDALRWDNPYTAFAAGAEQGELALSPDNQAQSLALSIQNLGSSKMQFHGMLNLGRLEQDDALLASSVNPSLSVPSLPRESADVQVDTLAAQLRLRYRVNQKLSLRWQYRHKERDNKTRQELFTQVVTDTFVADAQRNPAYSYEDDKLRLQTDYRLSSRQKYRLVVSYEERERSQQQRRLTEELHAYAETRLRRDELSLLLRLGWAERSGSAFESLSDPQQTLLQAKAFHLADREKQDVKAHLNWQLDAVQLGLQADYAEEDFTNSRVGLQAARRYNLNLSLAGQTAEAVSWQVYGHRSEAKLRQAGESGSPSSSWWGASHDVMNAVGLQLEKQALWPQVDVQLDYQFSQSEGRIQLDDGSFPELSTNLHATQLNAVYHWRPKIDYILQYRYERYTDSDWQDANLSLTSIPNVLGEAAPDSNRLAQLFRLSVQYRF